jgi:hypothetical protein
VLTVVVTWFIAERWNDGWLDLNHRRIAPADQSLADLLNQRIAWFFQILLAGQTAR